MSKLEKYDSVAELIGLNQEELNSRVALQAELLSIYQNEERNLFRRVNSIGFLRVMRIRASSTGF